MIVYRDWNQKLLDDLEIGKSRIQIDCGDHRVRGLYQGLIRTDQVVPAVWSIRVLCGGRQAKEEFVCTKNIVNIVLVRKRSR